MYVYVTYVDTEMHQWIKTVEKKNITEPLKDTIDGLGPSHKMTPDPTISGARPPKCSN